MSQQMADLHTLGPIVVAKISGGGQENLALDA